MTPDDITRRLERTKSGSDLIDRIAAALEGSSESEKILALTAVQAEQIILTAGSDVDVAKTIWEVTMRRSATMMHSMLMSSDQTIN